MFVKLARHYPIAFLICLLFLIVSLNGICKAEEVSFQTGTGWKLMSFWFATDSIITSFNDYGIEVYAYDPDAAGNYSVVSSSSELLRGNSYFVKSLYGVEFSFDADVYAATSTFSISLSEGWNLLGNPFSEDIDLQKLKVSGTPVMQGVEDLANQTPIYYGAKTYRIADGPLKKGEGFWLYASQSEQLSFDTPEPSLTADAGDDAKCIMGKYYTYQWNGSYNEYPESDVECTLDGSASYNPGGGSLTYLWSQVAGEAVTLIGSDTSKCRFVPPAEGAYSFQLTVGYDSKSSTDTVTIHAVKVKGKILIDVNLLQNHTGRHIYVMNGDGTGLQRLTTEDNIGNYRAHWSPDGQSIVYHSNEGDFAGDYEIYTISATNSTITKLTDNEIHDVAPDWGPDGKIIFTSFISPEEIVEIDPDGKNLNQLTTFGQQEKSAKYSFDGSMIAVRAEYGSDYEALVMDKDGNNLLRLTDDDKHQTLIRWTTDGRILFLETETDWIASPETLYVMNADGTGKKEWPVPDGIGEIGTFDMTDDGQYIVYTLKENAEVYIMCSDGSCNSRIGYYANTVDYHP